jgi:cytochrome c5
MKVSSLCATCGGLCLSPLAQAADGAAVYDAAVAMPAGGHAPAGDKAACHARHRQAALLASVLAGKGAMPPKAGNANLAEGDITAAIDYMLTAAK